MAASSKQTWTYEYQHPAMTVDIVLWTVREDRLQVLLIQRGRDPFAGKWAFPGGFVDPEEPLELTAARELREETGVRASKFWPINAFGDPKRDPRGWTISAAYYTVFADETFQPKADDDAKALCWSPIDRLPPLAFDHEKIFAEALVRFRRDLHAAPVAAPLLAESFTLGDLHRLYRLLDPAASPRKDVFRRRMEANGLIRPNADKELFRWASPP